MAIASRAKKVTTHTLQEMKQAGEKITKTIQLKDGKKFYRFALDK